MKTYLTFAISFLFMINLSFGQNCPTFTCNLISNPGLESGGPPSGLEDDFEHGLVDCWDNSFCGVTSNCLSIYPSAGNNTPDILDMNFTPSVYSGCIPNSYTDFGIPASTHCSSTPTNTPSQYGANTRYSTMFRGEAISATLTQPVRNKFYVVDFWARATDCLCPNQSATASMCVSFFDSHPNCVNAVSGGGVSLSGVDASNWQHFYSCIDLTAEDPSVLNNCVRAGFRMFYDSPTCTNVSARLVVDDFGLTQVADAGPDITICSGEGEPIGPPCENPDFNYTYNWSPATGLSDPTAANPIATPTTTTTYTLEVTMEWNGGTGVCIDFDEVTVTVVPGVALTLSSTPSTGSNGTATVNVSTGTANYTYQWSNGSSTLSSPNAINTISGLAPGTYTVTVTDANGCSNTGSITVTQITSMTLTLTTTDASCATVCNGSAVVTVAGGTPPFTYLWSDGQTTPTAIGLCPNIISVTVTDANGGTASVSGTIGAGQGVQATISGTAETCIGLCDGSASVVITAGTPPYTYQWSNGATTPSINSLCSGIFHVNIVDANGCRAFLNIDLTSTDTCNGCYTVTNPEPQTNPIPDQDCWWSTGGNSNFSVDGNNNFIGTTAGNATPLRLFTEGQERIHIDASGNSGFVGINTPTPGNRLEVNSAIDDWSGLRLKQLDPGSAVTSNPSKKVLSVDQNGDVILVDDQEGSGGISLNCNAVDIVPKGDGTGDLVCSQIYDNTVTVGINTINPDPSVRLQVNGNIYSRGGGYYTNDCNGTALPILRSTGDCQSSTLAVGHNAGNNNLSNSTFNSWSVFAGRSAGENITGVRGCTFIGAQAGLSFNTSGGGVDYNTFLGFQSGISETRGDRNTYLGTQAGQNMNISRMNTMVGALAGNGTARGDRNVFVGDQAGRLSDGSDNTFIGTNACNSQPGVQINNAGIFGANTTSCGSNTQRFGNINVVAWGFGLCPQHGNVMEVRTPSGNAFMDIGGQWHPASDRNVKENIEELNSEEVLEKIISLPVTRWNYIGAPDVKHIGPMAQDFNALFNVGKDEKHIAMLDPSGVALEGIKALNKKLMSSLEEKDAEMNEMKSRLNEMESALAQCCSAFEDANARIAGGEQATLGQNVPNPFNEKTMIGYYLPSFVKSASINVYTIEGQNLVHFDSLPTGRGNVTVDSGVLAPGAYLYNLVADGKQIDSKWMIVTK